MFGVCWVVGGIVYLLMWDFLEVFVIVCEWLWVEVLVVFLGLDLFVNNVGICIDVLFFDLVVEIFDKMMKFNVYVYFFLV